MRALAIPNQTGAFEIIRPFFWIAALSFTTGFLGYLALV